MTDITVPYSKSAISGSFSYDITNVGEDLTILTENLSAGTITVTSLDGTDERTIEAYTSDMADVIGPLKGRNIRVVGTSVTADYLSLA